VNRWGVRLMGLIMVLLFLLVFAHMYRTLKMLQRQAGVQTTTASKP